MRTTKIVAFGLVLAMISVSFAMISWTSTDVIAEDSARPLADLNAGYPNDDKDQSMEIQSSQSSINWDAQTFQAGYEGELTRVELMLWKSSDDFMDLRVGIWSTFGGEPNIELAGENFFAVAMPPSWDWVEFKFTNPIPLTLGNDYAIVVNKLSNNGFWKKISSDTYALGEAFSSGNGGASWTPLGLDYTFRTYMSHDNSGLSKIAWHPSGHYALGVTGSDDTIWRYTRQTMNWTNEKATTGNDIYTDIDFNNFFDVFYIVGEKFGDPITANAWQYNPVGTPFTSIGAPPLMGGSSSRFNGLCAIEDGTFGFIAVGYNNSLSGVLASWYSPGGGWINAIGGDVPSSDGHILYDVTENKAGEFYAVGADGSIGRAYNFPFAGYQSPLELSGNWNTTIGSLYGIEWAPDSSTYDYALAVGDDFGNGNIWKFEGLSVEELYDSNDIYKDVSWHPVDDQAVIVGYNSGSTGVILDYNPQFEEITVMSDGEYGKLYGVDIKSYSSPSSGLVVGATGAIGVFPSATDSSSQIVLNTAFPHIFDIDMWDMSDLTETSVLNSEVDVEDTYTFFTTINYTVGGVDQIGDGSNVTYVDLICWYDTGAELMNAPADADDVRTQKFTVRWMEGNGPGLAGQGAWVTSPVLPVLETTVVGSGISGPYNPVANAYHYDLWINVSFTSQMRAADLGGGGVASGDITDSAQSFNDADSWNIQMNVGDASAGAGAYNSVFEEFGLFKATNITVVGNPAGNAPPGSATTLSPYSFINYTANTNYYINVSVKDLVGPQTITADNIGVRLLNSTGQVNYSNSEIYGLGAGGAYYGFTAADIEQMIWGNTSQPTKLIPAPGNGTSAHGPYGSNYNIFGSFPNRASRVEWWVNVPAGVAEGTYTSQITFVIGDGW